MAGPMGVAKPMGTVAPPPTLNARVLFDRLDTNKDGELSFDEFDVAVRHLQRLLAARMDEMKGPRSDGMRSFGENWGQFRGQSGGPGMGPMGQHPGMGPMDGQPGMGPMGHPGMGPMGQDPGMGPMGQHPGMGPMGQHSGMGPMGQHPGMGPMGQHPGMGPMDGQPGMGPMGMMMGPFGGHRGPPDGKTPAWAFKAPDGEKHGVKKPAICKCGATKPEDCKCGAKKHVVCSKCGATTAGACTCGKKHDGKKHEGKKGECEKAAAGSQSIEARLTALETQQAEILKLLRSVTKSDHRGGGRGPHHGEH
jgi:hypothetical protein